ncbi:MAG: DUF4388 domain-containing protein [Polyangiales bacterium]
MTKQNLLVVDADPRSLRVLEVSLRNAGYNVAGCPSVGKAFEILHTNKPDLILSDTAFGDMNGFEFVEQLRQNAEWSRIPFMFLSSDESIESKIRGLELGVQDYLTKPIYIREVVARVGIELARQTRDGLAQRTDDAKTRFSGALTEMSVVDLLQTIDVSRKSGVLSLRTEAGDQGMISFDSGAVIHAAVEDLGGEDAVYRLLLWRGGSFDLEFRKVSLVERTVHRTTQALLMEGMRRLDEWSRLSELLPPFDVVLEVDGEVLRERLHDTPDDQNVVVRLIDGKRPIGSVIEAHGGDHVEALRKIVDLYFEGIVRELGEVKDSIPILAQAKMPVSSLPPRVPIDTIPGPGPGPGPKASLTPIAVPSLDGLPVTELAPSSKPAELPVSVPPASAVPNVDPASVPSRNRPASDLVPTPESLPSPIAYDADQWVPASQPPTVLAPASGSEAQALAGWAPAPPPSNPRKDTPGGFQTAKGGGTILNWAGRIPELDPVEKVRADAAASGDWDQTLNELRDDPEVAEAIAVIDSDPPPGPFVRSSPPPAMPPDPAPAVPEEPREEEAVERHEPAAADPPPLTYGQVSEALPTLTPISPPTIPVDARIAPRADGGGNSTEPARYVWLMMLVIAVMAIGYMQSPRGPLATREVERVIGEAAIEEADTFAGTSPPAMTATPTRPTELGAEPGVDPDLAGATKGTAAPDAMPAVAPTAEPEEPGIYAPTGAVDTYDAQLALARKLKRGSRATAAYRRAIELDPQASDPLAELARLQLGREHAREAAELAERATAIDSSNALAWVVLGASRQMRGDMQGARQAYRNCVKLGRGRYVRECRAMLP